MTLYTFYALEDFRRALFTGGAQYLKSENLRGNPVFDIFWKIIVPLFYHL